MLTIGGASAFSVIEDEVSPPSTKRQSDEELLHALGRGDPAAIATVYEQDGARMVAFASRYVKDRGAAEDVVVSLLGQWLERPPQIGSVEGMNAFLATSVYHAAIDWIRGDRAQQGQTPRPSSAEPQTDRRRVGPLRDVDSTESREVMRGRLEGALEHLPPSERLLLESHYGHALTAQECMEILGISRAAFHQRLHRARVHLASLLAVGEGANT